MSVLFNDSEYVATFDIYVDHTSGFQTFAQVAYYTPFIIIGISVLLAALAIIRPSRSSGTDYVQAFLTLLLFVPVFSFGVGQLVPQGNSIFLQEWLSSLAFWTALAFVVVAISAALVIALHIFRPRSPLPGSQG